MLGFNKEFCNYSTEKVTSAVSRFLSPPKRMPVIYLRPPLPTDFSCLPPDIGRAALGCRYTWHCTAQSLPDFTTAELYLLSVALVLPSRMTAVSRCAALRCPDFPTRLATDQQAALVNGKDTQIRLFIVFWLGLNNYLRKAAILRIGFWNRKNRNFLRSSTGTRASS